MGGSIGTIWVKTGGAFEGRFEPEEWGRLNALDIFALDAQLKAHLVVSFSGVDSRGHHCCGRSSSTSFCVLGFYLLASPRIPYHRVFISGPWSSPPGVLVQIPYVLGFLLVNSSTLHP